MTPKKSPTAPLSVRDAVCITSLRFEAARHVDEAVAEIKELLDSSALSDCWDPRTGKWDPDVEPLIRQCEALLKAQSCLAGSHYDPRVLARLCGQETEAQPRLHRVRDFGQKRRHDPEPSAHNPVLEGLF